MFWPILWVLLATNIATLVAVLALVFFLYRTVNTLDQAFANAVFGQLRAKKPVESVVVVEDASE